MNRKNKRILYFSAGGICLIVLLIGVRLIIEGPYRSGLPETPDMQTLPSALQEQISDASKKAHHNPTSDNLGTIGMVYHSCAYYDKASQCYKLAVKRNRSNWIWSYYLGYLNQEMGESETAIESFRVVIRENPQALMAWYYVGEGYRNQGAGYKAEVAFNKIVNLKNSNSAVKTTTRNDYFPLRVYALFQLSRIYMNSNRTELAVQTLKQILEFHRSFGPAYRLLGNIFSSKGDSVLSKYYSVRANDLADLASPVDTLIDKIALMSRSDLYLLKQIDEAEKSVYPDWALSLINSSIQHLPDNKYLISKAIKLLLRLDYGKEASAYLKQHFSIFKDEFDEMKEVADILYEKEFYSQALIYYYQASKLKPNDKDVQLNLALCLGNNNMKQNAVEMIDDLLNNNKGDLKVSTEAIYYLLLLGETEKARSYLAAIKQHSGLDPGVQKLSGMLAEQDGNLKDAGTMYELSFLQNPEDLSTIRYLGNVLVKQKKWSTAISHYRKALQFHPNDPYLLEKLGTLLVSCPDQRLRDYNEGKELSERAFIHNSCPAETLISSGKSLAEAYAGLGDNKNASVFMNITINLAKSENSPVEYLAELERELKLFSSSN